MQVSFNILWSIMALLFLQKYTKNFCVLCFAEIKEESNFIRGGVWKCSGLFTLLKLTTALRSVAQQSLHKVNCPS